MNCQNKFTGRLEKLKPPSLLPILVIRYSGRLFIRFQLVFILFCIRIGMCRLRGRVFVKSTALSLRKAFVCAPLLIDGIVFVFTGQTQVNEFYKKREEK